MNNLKELNKIHSRNWKAYIKRGDKLEKQIEELTKKKERLRFNSGLRELFKPFAEELKKRFKANIIEWYGPFGMCASQTIYFMKGPSKDICKKGNVLGSICFVSSSGGYAIRNEKVDNKSFSSGTLGAMNGMNHPEIDFTDKMNINWLYKWGLRQK